MVGTKRWKRNKCHLMLWQTSTDPYLPVLTFAYLRLPTRSTYLHLSCAHVPLRCTYLTCRTCRHFLPHGSTCLKPSRWSCFESAAPRSNFWVMMWFKSSTENGTRKWRDLDSHRLEIHHPHSKSKQERKRTASEPEYMFQHKNETESMFGAILKGSERSYQREDQWI